MCITTLATINCGTSFGETPRFTFPKMPPPTFSYNAPPFSNHDFSEIAHEQSPLPLTALTAITPIDGRYGSKVENLRAIFSEYGLIHARVLVEIRWLQQLANHAQISELPSFSAQANTITLSKCCTASIPHAETIKTRNAPPTTM